MRSSRLVVIAAMVLAATATVHAQEAVRTETFIVRLLGGDPAKQKVSACFVRAYGAAHLAQHPKQRVGAMMLLVSGVPDANSKKISYSFTLGVQLRGHATRYESAGACSHAAPVDASGKQTGAAEFGCGVDCDGGGFDLELAVDGKSIVLKLPESVSIWKKGEDDPERWQALKAGDDDKEFRLDRARESDCAPIAPAEEAATD